MEFSQNYLGNSYDHYFDRAAFDQYIFIHFL